MKLVDRIAQQINRWTDTASARYNERANGQKAHTPTFVGAPSWKNLVLFGGEANPDAEELTRAIALATSAYAYTAIMYRASRVAEPPLGVVEATEEGDIDVPDHELAMLLSEPSPDYDMGELQQLTEIYRLITGEALWVKEVDVVGRPARWVPFSGDEFTTHAAEGRIYGQFRLDTKARKRTYAAEEVVYFRDINPNSWRSGLSRLDVALAMLDLGHQVNRTTRNFLRNAMFPGGIISPDKDWNPDDPEWEAWKAHIAAWHQGAKNAGDPLILQGGTSFSKAAVGYSELMPTELLDRVEACVGAVFGTPPVVLGWKVGLENSPWSQMSEARLQTVEDTIEPRWRDVERRMTRQLLSLEDREAGRRIVFDTSGIRAFAADDATRATTAAAMVNDWTRNERRVYTGQDPLPEDDPRGDEIGSSSGGGGTFDLGEDDLLGLSMVLRKAVDTKVLEWTIFDVSTKAAERTWERDIANVLKRIQADILRLYDKHVEEEKQVDPDSVITFVAGVGTYLRETAGPLLEKTTLPLILSGGAAGVRRASAQTGIAFAILQPGLDAYAVQEASFLASVMCNSTGKAVAAVMQTQVAEGALIADTRKALLEIPGFSRKRAQLVARTQTTRVFNGAARAAMSHWQDTQPETVRVTKTWLTAQDDRVRDEHADLDGETVGINETFGTTGLSEPSEPNCRCTTVYGIEDAVQPSN